MKNVTLSFTSYVSTRKFRNPIKKDFQRDWHDDTGKPVVLKKADLHGYLMGCSACDEAVTIGNVIFSEWKQYRRKL